MSLKNILWNFEDTPYPYYALSDPPEGLTDPLTTGKASCWIFLPEKEDLPTHRDLLDNILSAVGLDLARDAALVAIPEGIEFNLAKLARRYHPEKILLFGFPFSSLGVRINLAPNTVYHLGKTALIRSESLSRLSGEKNLKAALWRALQQMFRLNER